MIFFLFLCFTAPVECVRTTFKSTLWPQFLSFCTFLVSSVLTLCSWVSFRQETTSQIQTLSEGVSESISYREAPSSCIGPLPVVNGVDVMRTCWHSFACTDAAVAENPPACACPQPPPPCGELLRSLLCSKEVCGRPEEFQQSFVAPVGPTALRPTVRRSHRADCTKRTGGTPLGLGGETAVTSAVG